MPGSQHRARHEGNSTDCRVYKAVKSAEDEGGGGEERRGLVDRLPARHSRFARRFRSPILATLRPLDYLKSNVVTELCASTRTTLYLYCDNIDE